MRDATDLTVSRESLLTGSCVNSCMSMVTPLLNELEVQLGSSRSST